VNSISSMMSIGAASYLRKPLYSYLFQEISSSIPSTPLTGEETLIPPNIMTRLVQSPGLPSIFIIPSNKLEPFKRISILRNVRNAMEEELRAKKNGNEKIVDERNGSLIAYVKDSEELLGLVQKCIVDKCQYRLSSAGEC